MSEMRKYRDTENKTEEALFSSGGTKRVIVTLQYFKDRMSVAKAAVASSQIMDGGNDDDINGKFNAVLVRSLKDFIGMFQCQSCNRYHRGEKLKAEDQNPYDVVMEEISGGEMTSDKIARYISRKIQV